MIKGRHLLHLIYVKGMNYKIKGGANDRILLCNRYGKGKRENVKF